MLKVMLKVMLKKALAVFEPRWQGERAFVVIAVL
jgi:hypothetical protein